jgi:D-threo-aldose 1-dehydrogenase
MKSAEHRSDADDVALFYADTTETYRRWNVEYLDFLLGCAAQGERPIDFVLLAGTYTLLDLSAWEDGILQKCLEHGVGVVIGGAFASGILATGAVPGAKFNYEDATEDVLERTRKLEAVVQEFDAEGVTLPAAALQFSLGHAAVTTVIPGCKSVAEAERSVATMNVDIPPTFWARLKEEGLLPQGVPVPA